MEWEDDEPLMGILILAVASLKPVETPTDLPVVEGSEMVDMKTSCLLREMPLRVVVCGARKAELPVKDAAKMATAVVNFILYLFRQD